MIFLLKMPISRTKKTNVKNNPISRNIQQSVHITNSAEDLPSTQIPHFPHKHQLSPDHQAWIHSAAQTLRSMTLRPMGCESCRGKRSWCKCSKSAAVLQHCVSYWESLWYCMFFTADMLQREVCMFSKGEIKGCRENLKSVSSERSKYL